MNKEQELFNELIDVKAELKNIKIERNLLNILHVTACNYNKELMKANKEKAHDHDNDWDGPSMGGFGEW